MLRKQWLRENSFLLLLYTPGPILFKIARPCSGEEYMRQYVESVKVT